MKWGNQEIRAINGRTVRVTRKVTSHLRRESQGGSLHSVHWPVHVLGFNDWISLFCEMPTKVGSWEDGEKQDRFDELFDVAEKLIPETLVLKGSFPVQ